MSSLSATRRASSTAPSAQQASSRCISGMLGRSGQTLSVTPMTSWPACLSSAAVTELSTPPDMPTMTFAMSDEILSQGNLDNVAALVHRIDLRDAPGADVGLMREAHQDVQRREIARQTDVRGRRPRFGVGMRVVVAHNIEPERVEFVVDAQLIARIHVVVDRPPSRCRLTGGAIAEDAGVSAHLA